MANGQTKVNPAESVGAGIPEILQNPDGVPEARAFYSGNPQFLDGAEERSGTVGALDAIEFSVIADASGKNANGQQTGIIHALRYMRVLEEREPKDQTDFVLLDHGLAVRGLKWIRKHVGDEEIHRSAVEALKHIKPDPESKPIAALPQAEVPPPPPSAPKNKRAQQERERDQQNQARQRKHESNKETELEVMQEWLAENPLEGTGHLLDILRLIGSEERPDGKIACAGKEGFKEATEAHVRYLIENPEMIQVEFEDIDTLRVFIEEYDIQIIGRMMRYSSMASNERYRVIAYEDGTQLREMIPRWLEVFGGFSEEYREAVTYDKYNVQKYGEEEEESLSDGAVNYAGVRVLHNTLVKVMETSPDQFTDLVYGMARAAINTENPFVRKSVLNLIARIVLDHPIANLLIMNSPLATDLERTERLKNHDLYLAMQEEGCTLYPIKIARRKVPKKMLRQYDRYHQLARQLSPDQRRRNHARTSLIEKIYGRFTGPLTQAIESGELPESLFLQIRKQKELPPQDA